MTTNGDMRVEFVADDVLVGRRIVRGHLKSKAVHPTPPRGCAYIVAVLQFCRDSSSSIDKVGGRGRDGGGMGLRVLDQRCRGITCIE